jgi:hypothetical protein
LLQSAAVGFTLVGFEYLARQAPIHTPATATGTPEPKEALQVGPTFGRQGPHLPICLLAQYGLPR